MRGNPTALLHSTPKSLCTLAALYPPRAPQERANNHLGKLCPELVGDVAQLFDRHLLRRYEARDEWQAYRGMQPLRAMLPLRGMQPSVPAQRSMAC